MKSVDMNNQATALIAASNRDGQMMRAALLPAAPAGPAAGSGGASLTALAQALRRRWPTALAAGAVAGALGVGLVLLLLPSRYTAFGAVQIVTRPSPKILKDMPGDGDDPTIFKGTMAARVKNPMVLMAAVKDLDIGLVRNQPNPVKWLETAIKTDFLMGPEILRITLSGEDPQETALLVNRIIDAFIDENRQYEEKRWRKDLETLEANRQKMENGLRRKKKLLNDLEQAAKIESEDSQKKAYDDAVQRVNGVRQQQLGSFVALVQLEVELESLKKKQRELNKMPIDNFYLDSELEKTEAGLELLKKQNLKKKDLANLEKFAPKSPQIAGLRHQLEGIQKEIDDLRDAYRPLLEKKWREAARTKLTFDIRDTQDKITAAKRNKDIYDGELKNAETEARSLNPALRRVPGDIEALRDEIKMKDVALTELSKVIAIIHVEPTPSPRVREWSRAEVPSGKDFSRQLKFGGAAGLGLFCLALVGVGYLELRTGRISGSSEVMQGLGMSVVGTLPLVPARARSLTSEAKGDSLWQSRLTEAVDSVRTYLMHASRVDEIQVVMITSADVGEGKTSLATQLAASLARAWRKTLLIDGDLRHPATHKLFDLPLEAGFAEVLRGEASPADVIKPTALSRLWLMPAGRCDAHAVQALAQDNVRTMFESLKQQYDFIIVDSCPVLPVADSLSLGQHVDGVLYAVLRDVSRVPALQAAQRRLSNLQIRTLGAVLIGTDGDVGNIDSSYAMVENLK